MMLDTEKYKIMLANKCLSDVEISKRCGVGRSTITLIKNGKQNPRPQTIGKIAKALGCSVEDLIMDKERMSI